MHSCTESSTVQAAQYMWAKGDLMHS